MRRIFRYWRAALICHETLNRVMYDQPKREENTVRSVLMVACGLLSVSCYVYGETPFWGVSAKDGSEWIEQCEKPAFKADGETRTAACFSFLAGAKAAYAAMVSPECAAKVNRAVPGALFDVSLYVARQLPSAPMSVVMKSTLETPCLPDKDH